jgi:hypothetical protein
MHAIIDKKFYLGPKFGTSVNRKWITNIWVVTGEWEADGTSELDIFAGGELRSKFGDPPSYPGWKTK